MFEINATLPIFVIMFLLFMLVLNAQVLKPIGFAIENRQKQIKSDLDQGSAARAAASELISQYEQRARETRLQGQAIIKEAEDRAKAEYLAKMKEVQQKGQALLQAEQAKIAAERTALLDQLVEEERVLVGTIVKKLLGDSAGSFAQVDTATARRVLEEVS